jgi:hypothetical protein
MTDKVKCKHKWRVGSKVGEMINRQIVGTKLNIWCEKCPKVIKANYFSDYELQDLSKFKPRDKIKDKKNLDTDSYWVGAWAGAFVFSGIMTFGLFLGTIPWQFTLGLSLISILIMCLIIKTQFNERRYK